jgi:hypothetical protein
LAFVRDNERFRQWMKPWRGRCVVLYSMWGGYLEKPAMGEFLQGFSYQALHTSGHATPETLQKVCRLTSPRKGVIPIHTEHPEGFQALLPGTRVVVAPDGTSLNLNGGDTDMAKYHIENTRYST